MSFVGFVSTPESLITCDSPDSCVAVGCSAEGSGIDDGSAVASSREFGSLFSWPPPSIARSPDLVISKDSTTSGGEISTFMSSSGGSGPQNVRPAWIIPDTAVEARSSNCALGVDEGDLGLRKSYSSLAIACPLESSLSITLRRFRIGTAAFGLLTSSVTGPKMLRKT